MKTQASGRLCPGSLLINISTSLSAVAAKFTWFIWLSNNWFTFPQDCELLEGDDSMQQQPKMLTYIKHLLYTLHILSGLILKLL